MTCSTAASGELVRAAGRRRQADRPAGAPRRASSSPPRTGPAWAPSTTGRHSAAASTSNRWSRPDAAQVEHFLRPAGRRPFRACRRKKSRRYRSATRANTRSRRRSMSWTTSTSSRKPGWPRLSRQQLRVGRLNVDCVTAGRPPVAPPSRRHRPDTAQPTRARRLERRARPPATTDAVAPPPAARGLDRARRTPIAASTATSAASASTSASAARPAGSPARTAARPCPRSVRAKRARPDESPSTPQQEREGIDEQPEGQQRERDEHDGQRRQHRPAGRPQGGAPAIQAPHRRAPPEAVLLPELGRAVDRVEQRADDAHAAPGDHVDLDAGLLERAQDAGVIGAGRPGPDQHERGSEMGGVSVAGFERRLDHHARLRREGYGSPAPAIPRRRS